MISELELDECDASTAMLPTRERSQRSSSPSWRDLCTQLRLLEFGVALLLMTAAWVVSHASPHQRAIPNIEVQLNTTHSIWARDPTINQKTMKQQVTVSALRLVGTLVPIAVNLFVNYVLPKFKRVRIIKHDTRDFLLSLALSVGLTQLLTQFTKSLAGRFRPCFYDMCGWQYDVVWDGQSNLCTNVKGEQEARKSFPSGHSSFAWATLLLLTLYLLGRSRLNCENRSKTTLRGGRKMLKLMLCFLPALLAAWIAVTRSVDNWHHYSDILGGSIIGASAACIAYGYNYGSIFSEYAGMPSQAIHYTERKKKKRDDPKETMATSEEIAIVSHSLK